MIWDPTQPMTLTTSNVFLGFTLPFKNPMVGFSMDEILHIFSQEKLPFFSGANFFSVGFREGIWYLFWSSSFWYLKNDDVY